MTAKGLPDSQEQQPFIRERSAITHDTLEERRQQTIKGIQELERMYERGDIERHAYFIKKRSLIRLL